MSLTAISPLDGRYVNKTSDLRDYFSEYALIRYRVEVELRYLLALIELPLPQLQSFPKDKKEALRDIYRTFSKPDAEAIKTIERTTNHDVKAVEYFIKEKLTILGLERYLEFVHFGLTSQDVNNTATPMLLRDGLNHVWRPELDRVTDAIYQLATKWADVPMLARTHGQPASPTRLGKEMMVFVERLRGQINQLDNIPFTGKFGGATGNFNAHYVTYPDVDWVTFADRFLRTSLQLRRSQFTTQIEHYDNLAAVFHVLTRIHTVLLDFCRDVWTYVSMDYFKQKVVEGEVGSSAMPHKVNPIDFENAEGNLGLANALCLHLAEELPVSRLQRDLTDSTVSRNFGVPIGHSLIALKSIQKGIGKLLLHPERLQQDLDANWAVVAEAIQNILRREGYPKPYEALKALTRGKARIDRVDIHAFIDRLNVTEVVKKELKTITPHNYVGQHPPLV